MFLLTQNNLMEFWLTATYAMCNVGNTTARFACFTNSSVVQKVVRKYNETDRMQIITRHAVQMFGQIGTESRKVYISYSRYGNIDQIFSVPIYIKIIFVPNWGRLLFLYSMQSELEVNKNSHFGQYLKFLLPKLLSF